MKILSHISKDKVYTSWLQSELYRKEKDLTKEEIVIIKNPNFANEGEASKREKLLLDKYGRSAILARLPAELEWHESEFEPQDVDKLYILPVFDWYMDTGETFKVSDTLIHLSDTRGYHLPQLGSAEVLHFQTVNKIIESPPEDFGEVILIASSQDGPYTVIDGTHRSVALLKMGKLIGSDCFVGVGNLSQCIWSIERLDLSHHLDELDQLKSLGNLW